MSQSSIEWTEMTWNPTTGCTKISAGCKHCYAEVMTKRLLAMGVPKYAAGFKVAVHEEELTRPYSWKNPRKVFVNSMSDLFHPDIPLSFIQQVFEVMNQCSRHTFQVLTKRGELLEQYGQQLGWTNNIWMGVSVENQKVIDRIDHLRRTPAQVRFLSLEPLLGPLPNLDLTGIHWVIVGGESGPRARPMREEWVADILQQCTRAGVAFFFKQWGGRNKKATGRLLQGRTYDEMPVTTPLANLSVEYAPTTLE
jgi:protein gp37